MFGGPIEYLQTDQNQTVFTAMYIILHIYIFFCNIHGGGDIASNNEKSARCT